MTAVNTLPDHGYAGGAREALTRLWESRTKYLLGAICVALCIVMLTPLVVSVLESLKTTEEAAALPPTYYPHILSLDSYRRLWNFQAGLPVYLFNSTGAALLTIVFCLALTIPAGYALARFPIAGQGRVLCLPAAFADHPLSGVGQSRLLHVRQAAADQLAGRPGDPAHGDPDAVSAFM